MHTHLHRAIHGPNYNGPFAADGGRKRIFKETSLGKLRIGRLPIIHAEAERVERVGNLPDVDEIQIRGGGNPGSE